MLLILTLILISQQAIGEEHNILFKEVFNYHNETANKASFANDVVNIIYNAFSQWYFTVTFCEFTYFENRILKYIENTGYGYNVMLLSSCSRLNKSDVKPKYDKHGGTTYIITLSDLSMEFTESAIDALKRTGVFKPRSSVVFVVNTPIEIDKYFITVLRSHFQLLWSRRITNSLLIIKSDQLYVYTYNRFLNEVRDITGIKDMDSLVYKQYDNLFGYPLKLSVFRKVFVSDKTGPVNCDSNLAKTVIKHMNASCLPLSPRDDSTVGDLLANGTATGVTSDLIDEYSDLELNSRILKNSYYGYIDTTYPFDQDELCFLIKKSGTQSTFNTTMQLLSGNILLLFTFTFTIFIVITILVWNIEKKSLNITDKRTMGETVMDLIKCFIRQTVDYTFSGPIFRFLVLLIIIYSLIVDCVIDGVITAAITYPHYKLYINSLEELAKSNLTLGIHNRDISIVNESLNSEFYEQIMYRIQLVNDRKIKEVIDSRNFQYALLLRKSDALYISIKTCNIKNGQPLFHVIPDCPLPCFIVYGLSYGSPYLPRVNYIILQLYQSGILQHWSKIEENTYHRDFISAKTKEKTALTIKNVVVVFYVLLIGEIISISVLILELLYHKLTIHIK